MIKIIWRSYKKFLRFNEFLFPLGGSLQPCVDCSQPVCQAGQDLRLWETQGCYKSCYKESQQGIQCQKVNLESVKLPHLSFCKSLVNLKAILKCFFVLLRSSTWTITRSKKHATQTCVTVPSASVFRDWQMLSSSWGSPSTGQFKDSNFYNLKVNFLYALINFILFNYFAVMRLRCWTSKSLRPSTTVRWRPAAKLHKRMVLTQPMKVLQLAKEFSRYDF